jgi:hypothetical protein
MSSQDRRGPRRPALHYMKNFRSDLAARFLLKFHMTPILIGTLSVGVFANKWLNEFGVTHILLQYPAAIIFSFPAFLFLMRLLSSTKFKLF